MNDSLTVSHDNELQQAGYVRSQLYTATTGVNPLVATAQPLLSICHRVGNSQKTIDPDHIISLVHHEFQAFESRAISLEYTHDTVMVAKYMLSIVLEELLKQPSMEYLFLPVDQAATPGFFPILKKLLTEPKNHIELLELCYLCLSLGYQGSYKGAHQELEILTDHLYSTIRLQRGDFKKKLLLSKLKSKKINHTTLFRLPIKWYGILSLGIVCFAYLSFNFIITQKSKPVNEELQRIVKQMPKPPVENL